MMKLSTFIFIWLSVLGCKQSTTTIDSSKNINTDTAIEQSLPRCFSDEYIRDRHINNLQQYYNSNLDSFLQFLPIKYESIKEIVYNDTDSLLVLNIIQNDSVNYFDEAPELDGFWIFDYYHDIYGTLFNYPKINKITILSDSFNLTFLPVIGNFDPIKLPKGIMLKKWYFIDVDYSFYIDIENENLFKDNFSHIRKDCLEVLLNNTSFKIKK